MIVTSNKQFGRWGEVFGDDVVAAAMIDRLVHHVEDLAAFAHSLDNRPRKTLRHETTRAARGAFRAHRLNAPGMVKLW